MSARRRRCEKSFLPRAIYDCRVARCPHRRMAQRSSSCGSVVDTRAVHGSHAWGHRFNPYTAHHGELVALDRTGKPLADRGQPRALT